MHLKQFKIAELKHESGKEFQTGIRRKIKKCLQLFAIIKGIKSLKRCSHVQVTIENLSEFFSEGLLKCSSQYM